MQINSTQTAGLLAFVPATVIAAIAFWRSRHGGWARGGPWAPITAVHASFAIEVIAGGRHRLNSALGSWLKADGLYDDRRTAQAVLIIVAVLLAALLLGHMARKASTRLQSLAIGATGAAALLFVVESISLHAIDAALYRFVGPVLLIGWLWLACGG